MGDRRVSWGVSPRVPVAIVLAAATLGLMFAGFSTLDFVAHFDRQVHDLHCSYVPGIVAASDEAHGCQVTLLSPYSSVLRTWIWGGVPISLPAMAVFAFLLFRGLDVLGRSEAEVRPATAILLGATLVPVVASIVMGSIAVFELHATCKLCIGIYAASGVAFVGAVWAWWSARTSWSESMPVGPVARGPMIGMAIAQALVFVALPVFVYVLIVPDFSRFVGACGKLAEPSDPSHVMVKLGEPGANTAHTIEVLDPLCPSCRALEDRLAASEVSPRLHRSAVLFPLDSACNWMVEVSMHPGACAVSEAILCADRRSGGATPVDVLGWAFEHQDEIMAATRKDPNAAARMVRKQFSALDDCVGSAEVRARLNKSLRWVVTNRLPVLTPQVFVEETKVCAEDTDLGLDWMLTRLLERTP